MDGIANSLTSVIPIIPDNSTITNKNGASGPPVEIAPLPQNSFLSDDLAAELLNNPYTLNLDSDGQSGQAAGGAAGSPFPEDVPPGQNDGAYTLDLGTVAEPEIPERVAYEMSRAKNYEALGNIFARRAVRPARETPVPPGTGVITGTEDNVTDPVGQPTRLPAQGKATETVPLADTLPTAKTVLTSILLSSGDTEAMLPYGSLQEPEPAPGIPQTDTGKAQPLAQQDGAQQDGAQPDGSQPLPDLAARLTERLSSSDLQTMMSLEPDLRDAFLRMINGEQPTVTAPTTGQNPSGDETAFPMPGTTGAPATAPDVTELPVGMPPEKPVREWTFNPEFTRAAPPATLNRPVIESGNGLPSLAAAIVTAAAAESVAPRGNLENLKKIKELPYSLYLFGPVIGQSREEDEEEETYDAAEKQQKPSGKKADYLKLSEAVRMASVLHNLYLGGSGRFEEETPWYLPYIRYAVKHGIIKSGDFEDYNEIITHAEAAYIFSGSVPAAALPVINHISGIPDVDENEIYGEQIYLLLRAGVITTGGSGFFYPERFVTRSEAAVLAGRIATPADRKRF